MCYIVLALKHSPSWGWSSSTEGKVLAMHTVDPSSILATPYNPLSPWAQSLELAWTPGMAHAGEGTIKADHPDSDTELQALSWSFC